MQILVVGNVNVDMLLGRLDVWPERGTEVLLPEFEQRLGGPLGNMAHALHKLGARARYFSNVGDDALGQQLSQELRRLDCEPEVSEGATSVTMGVVHGDGQRTFFTSPGHLDKFSLESTFEAVEAARPGDLLFVSGYFLLPVLRRSATELLARARSRGLVTALDTGWPTDGWDPAARREVLDLLKDVSWFLPNEIEMAAVTADSGGLDLVGQLELLDGGRLGSTLVKLGGEGAAWLENGSLQRVRATPVTVRDSVGAGDSFNAGFIAALQNGCNVRDAAALAVAVASQAISTSPRTYPTWEQLTLNCAV